MEPFLSFLAVAAVAILVPGPDTFVVLRTALADGPRAGTWVAAGSACGNLLWGTASLVGVAGVLAASQTAFAGLKLAGAAYLIFLGAQALRAAVRGELLADDEAEAPEVTARAAFRRGLACDLLNVKVGLFWTALVPQFFSGGAGPLIPVAMVASMSALAFAWFTAYAHVAARLSHTLRSRRSSVAINGSVGSLLVAFGARLALSGR